MTITKRHLLYQKTTIFTVHVTFHGFHLLIPIKLGSISIPYKKYPPWNEQIAPDNHQCMVGRRSFPHISWVGVHPLCTLYNRLGPFFIAQLVTKKALRKPTWLPPKRWTKAFGSSRPNLKRGWLTPDSKARTAVSEGLRWLISILSVDKLQNHNYNWCWLCCGNLVPYQFQFTWFVIRGVVHQ